MFLYEGDCLKNVTVIHGVRYVTVSHYGGDVETFVRLNWTNLRMKLQWVWIWLFLTVVGIVCLNHMRRRTPDGTGKRCNLLPTESG